MNKRYQKLLKQKGIRKDLVTGKYQASKKINGVQHAESFDSVRDAQFWRSTFNGKKSLINPRTTSGLGFVWQRMKELHFPCLEKTTQRIWERRFKHLEELSSMHIEEITSTVLNRWIEKKKKYFQSEEYLKVGRGNATRCNLYNELNLFSTIFNWYKFEDEFEEESKDISSPVRLRHKQMAYIREPARKPDDKKITVEAAFKLFSALPDVYRDLAMTQFYCAGRIGEIAGIQLKNIYFDQEFILIKDSVVWTDVNKTFSYLKPFPKNRDTRRVHIHSILKEIIDRRIKLMSPGCDYLFHIEGKPLNYCTIQSNYRSAQLKTGIPYTGTHCLRHGMATLARKVGGMGLDSVVAMTGHKDLKLAAHYSKIDGEVQKETSLKILDHIQRLGFAEEKSVAQENAKTLEVDQIVTSANNVFQFRRVKGG